jgi:hypothetical protein
MDEHNKSLTYWEKAIYREENKREGGWVYEKRIFVVAYPVIRRAGFQSGKRGPGQGHHRDCPGG